MGRIQGNRVAQGADPIALACFLFSMETNRKLILLRAAYDLLKKCYDSRYVVSPMEITAYYDQADCDGHCLMSEIRDELGLDEGEPPLSAKANVQVSQPHGDNAQPR